MNINAPMVRRIVKPRLNDNGTGAVGSSVESESRVIRGVCSSWEACSRIASASDSRRVAIAVSFTVQMMEVLDKRPIGVMNIDNEGSEKGLRKVQVRFR